MDSQQTAWKAQMQERWGLSKRSKVAIVGFCNSNRDGAPYNDPEFEIWGLNRGYIFMPRADRWFEMHGRHIYASETRRAKRHVEWLNSFQGPVYMHQAFEEVKQCEVFPLKKLGAHFGANVFRTGATIKEGKRKGFLAPAPERNTAEEPYLAASITYEIALAIYEGFEEIALYGIDLNTDSEYAWQKPSVEYFLGVAAGRGIKVVLPDNCPLLKGTLYGRGYLSERPQFMSYDQLNVRMKALQKEQDQRQQELAALSGAARELEEFILPQMIPGVDMEAIEKRLTEMKQAIGQLQAKLLGVHGAMKETQYWVHQTEAGQDPREAIAQLGAEGPVDTIEEFMHPETAVNLNGHHAEELTLVGA